MDRINWVALCTITRREVQRFLRIWTQTLLPSPITILLYFAIFGELIGRRVGNIDGIAYIEYIAPGLIMMAIINNAFSNVVSSFFGTKFQKNIEEMLVSPMSNGIILIGFVLGGMARGILVGLIVTLVSMAFTHLRCEHVGLMFGMVVLTSLLFSVGGFINAMFAKKFDDISIIPTFILTPLTYLGGVFYSVNMLDSFWHKVSFFNPILYMVNVFRYSMIGVSDVSIPFSLSILIALNIALFSVAWLMLAKGWGLKT